MIRKKLFCYRMRTKEALISSGVDPGFLERECIFSLGTRCPVYFKTINAVKLHISTLCQICFQNKQPRYNL